jgi:hypothetical protein
VKERRTYEEKEACDDEEPSHGFSFSEGTSEYKVGNDEIADICPCIPRLDNPGTELCFTVFKRTI